MFWFNYINEGILLPSHNQGVGLYFKRFRLLGDSRPLPSVLSTQSVINVQDLNKKSYWTLQFGLRKD